MGRFYSKFA
uniref:Uncharacterized protein n=1 Tax=Arundo donax TaxID=35708 RepID=A0A0A9GV86_ARUDO